MALIPALLLCACAEKNDDHEGHEGHDMTAHVDAPSDPATTSAAAHASGQPLVDIDGVQHGTLAAPASGKWTSLFFVRTDCPISNQYAPEIKRICTEYGPQGLQCLMVYADTHDNIEAVRRHRSEFGYSLPAILDPGHALVAQAGATITPEAVVFAAGATSVYGGRIDNLYTELGRPRQQVTEHDLRNALADLVAGRPVGKPRTPATGCFIE